MKGKKIIFSPVFLSQENFPNETTERKYATSVSDVLIQTKPSEARQDIIYCKATGVLTTQAQ